jgi:hypothetical protein
MTFWNPLTLEVSKAAARAVFLPALLPGLAPNPVPLTFFLALENAMVAAWPAASATPGTLVPLYAPLPIAPAPPPIGTFVPGALAATLVSTVVPVGLASTLNEPPMIAITQAIAPWTPLSFVAFTPGSPPVPTPIV